jgi:hypothetical protein
MLSSSKLMHYRGMNFKYSYHMVTESEAVTHANYVAFLLWIIVSKHLQNLYLYLPLFMKLLLVFQDLQGNVISFLPFSCGLVVDTPYNYAEGSSAKLLNYFVSVVYLVSVLNRQIVTVLTVEPVVIDLKLHLTAFLLFLRARLLRKNPIEHLSFAI